VYSYVVILEDFTAYGHLTNYDANFKETLIIILPSSFATPEIRILTFHNHSDGFNRLYFFNAMQNEQNPSKGKIAGRFCCPLEYLVSPPPLPNFNEA